MSRELWLERNRGSVEVPSEESQQRGALALIQPPSLGPMEMMPLSADSCL